MDEELVIKAAEEVMKVDPSLLEQIMHIPVIGPYLPHIGMAIGLAKTITPWIDSRSTNPAIDIFKRVLNFIAMNFGKDKNHDHVKHDLNIEMKAGKA